MNGWIVDCTGSYGPSLWMNHCEARECDSSYYACDCERKLIKPHSWHQALVSGRKRKSGGNKPGLVTCDQYRGIFGVKRISVYTCQGELITVRLLSSSSSVMSLGGPACLCLAWSWWQLWHKWMIAHKLKGADWFYELFFFLLFFSPPPPTHTHTHGWGGGIITVRLSIHVSEFCLDDILYIS